MLRASVYITACSTRNRTRRWLRRLREPRYLFGFLAAVAYLYFAVFRRFGRAGAAGRRRRSAALAVLPSFAGAGPALAGMGLVVAAAASWLVPGTGRLLEFSPAEVQFLFPAPVRRRQLLIHRLLRSQMGLLFASLVPSLALALPSGSATSGLRTVIAVWLLLVTARVYFSGVTLARSQFFAQSRPLRRLARLPLAVSVAVLTIVGVTLIRAFAAQAPASAGELVAAFVGVAGTPRVRIVLWPFETLVQPLFAATLAEYVAGLAGGVVVLAVVLSWVLGSDGAFQDVATDVVERQQQPQQGRAVYRARKTEWRLAPTGRPEAAFIWKTAMQTLRVVDRRVITRVAVIVAVLSVLIVSSSRTRGASGVIGLFAAAAAAYTALLAPQVVRLDFRQDLQHLELLKTWPLRPAAVVRGEIMGPALLLTVLTWLLIGLALFHTTAAFSTASAPWRLSIGLASVCLAPAVIFGQYTVHNGIALILPAWVPLGVQRPRGLDAMGQRLLTLGGTWLGVGLMLLPGGLVGGLLGLVFYRLVGPWILVPAAGICALATALEILLTTEALGPAYERLDLTAVERPD
jgi:hypothetical protein